MTSHENGNTTYSSTVHDMSIAIVLSGTVKSYQHGSETPRSIVTSYGTSYTTQSGTVTYENGNTTLSDTVTSNEHGDPAQNSIVTIK